MMSCQALPIGAGFISSMTSYVDCQAQMLGSGAWQALAMPGSTLSIVLSGFLTIFIAVIGYNLLLGQNLTVRSGTLAFVKVGAVLALATSWPAYRTLVYDLVLDGPTQLVGEIGPSAGVVGSDGTLLQRLDLTDQALAQLAVLGPGNPDRRAGQTAPPPWAGFNAFALGGSRILFLLTAIAGMGAVRIVTGLLLALGPFFVAFLMFDSTRSLFEGWVRVLAGAALAAVGLSITLGLQLALVEPWISDVLARRMAGATLPNVPTELFVVTVVFAIISVVAMVACARVARAFRLPPMLHLLPAMAGGILDQPKAHQLAKANQTSEFESERSRAATVAAVAVAMNRREKVHSNPALNDQLVSGRQLPTASPGQATNWATTPVGRSFMRRSASRVSATATRRDALA